MARLTLAGLAVGLPFWQGGASWLAVAVAAGCVGVAWLFAWPAVPHKPPRTRIAWLWLGLGAYSALQVLPLPRGLVALLHPAAVDLADAATRALALAPRAWLPIALTPGDAAFQAAVYLIAGAASALTALVLMGSGGRSAVHRFVNLLLGATVATALLWLLAHVPELESVTSPGLAALARRTTFVNPNHIAGFINLGIALAIGRVVAAPTSGLRFAYGVCATLLAVAVLASTSRGGALALGLTVALTILSIPRPAKSSRADVAAETRDARRRVLSIAFGIGLAGALLALPILEEQFTNGDLAGDPKVAVWRRLADLLGGAWLVGRGEGGIAVVVGMGEGAFPKRTDFAENFVLERLVGAGLPASIVFFAGLLWVFYGLRRRGRGMTSAAPLFIGLTVMLAHNLVDFSLELAGCLVPFLVLGGALERILPPPSALARATDVDRSTDLRITRRILWGSGAALALAGALLAGAHQRQSRDVSVAVGALAGTEAVALVADAFAYDHHAFYLLGRQSLEAGDRPTALLRFDRAVALRPDSIHARLFRFATRLEVGDRARALQDLKWLLRHGEGEGNRVFDVCGRSRLCEPVLLDAIVADPTTSETVARHYFETRPDLVERIAVTLRAKYPDRRFAVEGLRGLLYAKRGLFEPARRISAELLANPATADYGWMLEGHVLGQVGRLYEAFHLFKELCERTGNYEACTSASMCIVGAKRPREALAFVRSLWPKLRDQPATASLYWQWMAQVQYQLDRFDDALESARVSHGLRRDDVTTTLTLVACLTRTGNHGEARDLLDPLRAHFPDNAEVKRLWAEIEAETRPVALHGDASATDEAEPHLER
ncbi:MAG: hypothetical protein EXR79_07135 [Myxococcales bacterium]|nr:hypothetical protein [Myxococcales bacterium]